MATQSPNSFAFYPSQEYIDKGWAPMEVDVGPIQALAKSQALAEHHGLIDSETAKYYLPSALREGRWEDYGVNAVAINQRNSPNPEWDRIRTVRDKAVLDAYKQAQITKDKAVLEAYSPGGYKGSHVFDSNTKIPGVTQLDQLMNSEQYWDSSKVPNSVKKTRNAATKLGFDKYYTEIRPTGSNFGKYDVYYPSEGGDTGMYSPENLAKNAALKTLALINKREETGRTGLDLWERYNGAGPMAKKYKRNLEQTYNLMEHTSNKDMWKAYNNMVNQYKMELKRGK